MSQPATKIDQLKEKPPGFLQQKPLWGIFGQRSRFPGSHAGDTSINLCVISSPRKNRCR